MDASKKDLFRFYVFWLIFILCGVAVGLGYYRLHKLYFHLEEVLPKRLYTITLIQSFAGHGTPVDLNTYLPQSEFRQKIVNEDGEADDLRYEVFVEDQNKWARWRGDRISNDRTVRVTFKSQRKRFDMMSIKR